MKHIPYILLVVLSIIITYLVTPRPYIEHHHANFAVYVDGKKWDFSWYQYMEEVSRCNISEWVTPEDRIHLHDGKGGLVHVHMAASTWGDLFANLYWGIWSGYIQTDRNNFYTTNKNSSIYYILNGSIVNNPANIPVWSTDRLLVWYGSGNQDEILKKWDTLVENDAIEYNKKADPASCSTNAYGWFLWTIGEWIHNTIWHQD